MVNIKNSSGSITVLLAVKYLAHFQARTLACTPPMTIKKRHIKEAVHIAGIYKNRSD